MATQIIARNAYRGLSLVTDVLLHLGSECVRTPGARRTLFRLVKPDESRRVWYTYLPGVQADDDMVGSGLRIFIMRLDKETTRFSS